MCLVLLAVDARAQDPLTRAKDLYLAAAYDEALVLLEQLKSQPQSTAATEVEQYRAFCLLALDRGDEARHAIEDIVARDPFYKPSETQTPPRIRAVFENTRKSLLPKLVQGTYADAKSSFEKKDPAAAAKFERVLTLLDDPELKSVPQFADLRTVVAGFRDLSLAIASVPPPSPPPAQAPPTRQPAPPQEAAAAAPREAQSASPDPAIKRQVDFTPPVAISQPIPQWVAPNNIDARKGFKGVIEVTIDENGDVVSAAMQHSVHPLYDAKLLAAARTWKYRPAMRNGVPMSSLKAVEVQLQPTR